MAARFVATGLVLLASLAACSRSARQPKPAATLSNSPQAAAAFAPIREQWRNRKLDRAAIVEFIKRYPTDGAVPLAKVYDAFALIEAGQPLQADGVLATLENQPPGTTRDLATVAKARALRLQGAPQSALDSLRPLVGKIIDDADREIFLEELALAALAARDDYEALAYLDAWLRGAGEDDREIVRQKIGQIIDGLPRGVLEQTYRAMRERGTASGYGPETQRLVAARLAHIAVDTNDAALARWLLDVSGTSAAQAGGDAGLELGELATSRRGISIVSGKTVGLLLPTRNRELRDEAADVVRGVSWALDLPRSAGSATGVRLVTRDDGEGEGGTRAAMEELAGEGASVIIGGFDRKSADRASAWSEQSGVPVLLLSAPSAAHMPKNSAIVLGERVERELTMLVEALARHGVKTSAFVADTIEDESAGKAAEAKNGLVLLPPARCDLALAEAGKTRFPVPAWFASGAQGWLVSGPSGCASDLLRDVRRVLEQRPRSAEGKPMALTLEAGVPPSEVPKGVLVLSASAGLVPVAATRPEEAHDDDVRQFMERFGVRPTYWTAIGRDAGVLARTALAPLPADSATDVQGVTQRRAIVQAGLLAARVRLWTTDDMGVGKDRVLPRALRLVTWTPPK
ncbi:hypothetical protein [Labilithrix luteola]|uniref:hypothetical protein n=1 Tax=Labilithrix luteola TaxID=1391654 RepID=UPI0011BADCAE|nr:hypothetical protein [Labilithrix luteola]